MLIKGSYFELPRNLILMRTDDYLFLTFMIKWPWLVTSTTFLIFVRKITRLRAVIDATDVDDAELNVRHQSCVPLSSFHPRLLKVMYVFSPRSQLRRPA